MKTSNLLPDMTPVESSSSVESVGHDGHSLWIQFRNGSLYQYPSCPAEHHAGILGAESAGKHFAANVRNRFTGHRVD